MTYSEKLKDPRWQKARLQVFERDKWTCQSCGETTQTLAVHHRYYERGREPWDYPLTAFATICQDCHEAEHEGRERAGRDLIFALQKAGFFSAQISQLASAFDQDNPLSPTVWPRVLSSEEVEQIRAAVESLLEKIYAHE